MKLPRLTIKKSQDSIIFQALLLVLTFAYIFSLKFTKFEWMPATRFVFLICTTMMGIKIAYFFKEEIRKNIFFYVVQFFVLVYIIGQVFLMPTDFGMLSKIVVFLVFTLYMAAAGSLLFKDVDHFLKIVAICCSIQSLMVFISFMFPSYREWLSRVMVEGGNIPFSDPFRVPGFSTGSGASLALALSIGTFASMALYWKAITLTDRFIYLCSALLISSSCILVGKLGLFLSIAYILLFLFISLNNIKHSIVILSLSITMLVVLYLYLDIDMDTIAYPLERSFAIFFNGEDASVTALGEMPIPPISLSTLLGSGLAATAAGYNASGSDIGYIQTYYGFGLIFSILFYFSLLFYLIVNIYKLPRSTNKFLCLVFFIPLFIIEFKEPFITKVTYPLILFVLIFLSRKELKNQDSVICYWD